MAGRVECRRSDCGTRNCLEQVLDGRTYVRVRWCHCSGGSRPTRLLRFGAHWSGPSTSERRLFPMSVVLSEPVGDVVAAVEKLRADDALVASPERQLNELEALRDAMTSLEAVFVRRLRAARDADAPRLVCGRTAKGWLREELFLSGAETSRYMRCVFRLQAYPLVQAAFDTADISLARVMALMGGLDKLPVELQETLEPLLVEHARLCPPEDIAGFIDELLDALGADTASDARRERRLAERGVDLHPTMDGMRSLTGTLTPEVG